MSILDSIKANGKRMRGPMGDLDKAPRPVDDVVMGNALRTLWRDGDVDLIQNAIIERYATIIVDSTDDTGSTTQTIIPVTQRDAAMTAAIQTGQYELGRLYLFDSLVRQTATLFTVPTSVYQYDAAGLDETMREVRQAANCEMATFRWDALACGCGSSALFVTIKRDQLWETEVPLTSLWWAFPEYVDIEGYGRDSANHRDLDDASIVVYRLDGGDDKDKKFAAWIGPCDQYPLGRHCTYTADVWHKLPDVGERGSTDFGYTGPGDPGTMIDGDAWAASGAQLANPLSLWSERQRDWTIPTYPFSPMHYDPLSTGLFPTNTSLYRVCQEFDIASGLVLNSALRGARGQRVLQRTQGGPIPANADEGTTVLSTGQTLTVTGWPASNAKDAMEVIDRMSRHIAEAHNVPGWLVVADGEMPSGVAIKLMTQPLQDFRTLRAKLNRSFVARRFNIERALINMALAPTKGIPVDAVETWDAGQRDFPEDEIQLMDAWSRKIEMGVADLADVFMDLNQVDTREKAITMLEERKKEREKHAEIFEKPKPAVEPQQPQQFSPFGQRPNIAAMRERRAQQKQPPQPPQQEPPDDTR